MPFRSLTLPLIALLAVLAGGVAPVASSEPGKVKAVLELFTSQGCSSCPKADKLLGELADNPKLLPLSLSVNYWDYLGWRDTLALPAHSARQKGYAGYRGDRQVYTPQIVLNGTAEAIGNDRAAIEKAVANVETQNGLTIPVALKRSGQSVDIEVGGGTGPNASIWLMSVIRRAPVMIERGENRGKTITYHNVVRSWTKLADWHGSAVREKRPLADLTQGADMLVVIVQAGSVEAPGPIRGAAMLAVR